MRKLKIFIDGATGVSTQKSRIEQGFVELGHEITHFINESDLIYSNNQNSSWNQIFKDKEEGKLKKNCKIIFTVLDIPTHLLNINQFNLEELGEQLTYPDAICSISKFVHGQLEYYYGINSHIIYQPIQNINDINSNIEVKKYKYLHVGRRYDFNKNYNLIPYILNILNESEYNLANIGNETVNYGTNLAVVNENYLGKYYRSADYCFALGEVEGIGLGAIEAMSQGCIPVILNCLTTKEEFFPHDIFPEYRDCYKHPVALANFIKRFEDDFEKKQEFKERLMRFYKQELEEKFTRKGVARRIINVYNNIK